MLISLALLAYHFSSTPCFNNLQACVYILQGALSNDYGGDQPVSLQSHSHNRMLLDVSSYRAPLAAINSEGTLLCFILMHGASLV